MDNRPKIGLGVFLFNENEEILLMKRTSKHAYGTWAPPGGYLEYGESFEECAKRELKEELNLDAEGFEVIGICNSVYPEENKHVIAIEVKAKKFSGTPEIMEPEKCSEFGWFNINNLPRPLMRAFGDFMDKNSKWAYRLEEKNV